MPQSQAQPPYRLALLAHSHELAKHVRMVMRDRSDEMIYEFVDFETGPAMARACLEAGSEVVICHGGTGNAILRSLGHSVVAIDRTDMDVIKALRRAKQVSDHVILAAYRDERHDLEEMEALLDLKIHHISYETHDALFREINIAYERGIHLLVGGGGEQEIHGKSGRNRLCHRAQPA